MENFEICFAPSHELTPSRAIQWMSSRRLEQCEILFHIVQVVRNLAPQNFWRVFKFFLQQFAAVLGTRLLSSSNYGKFRDLFRAFSWTARTWSWTGFFSVFALFTRWHQRQDLIFLFGQILLLSWPIKFFMVSSFALHSILFSHLEQWQCGIACLGVNSCLFVFFSCFHHLFAFLSPDRLRPSQSHTRLLSITLELSGVEIDFSYNGLFFVEPEFALFDFAMHLFL